MRVTSAGQQFKVSRTKKIKLSTTLLIFKEQARNGSSSALILSKAKQMANTNLRDVPGFPEMPDIRDIRDEPSSNCRKLTEKISI
jgi:hypothetical protein